MATWQPSESSESAESSGGPELFHPFGPSGPSVPSAPPEMTMPDDQPLDGERSGDTPTEQFEPDFDDTEGDGFRLMDRFTCVADAESEPPVQAVGDDSRRRRLAVIAVLTAFAVLSGVLVGYATVRSMGGWSATWIGGDRQPGAAPSEDPDDAEVRQGAPPSSAGPSPSASPTASPTTGSSARPRPGVTLTRPAPSPTWTTPPPSPSTTASEPPGPQPSRTKKPPNDD